MISKAVRNGRQIYLGLLLYSRDYDDQLPPGNTSNAVFRELFRSRKIEKEFPFSAPFSSSNPDGNIGTPPDFSEAVEPDENHWMLLRQEDAFTSEIPLPLLVESADMSTGIPLWHPERAGTDKPGRTWSEGRVIVCFTDGTVSFHWKTADGNKPTSRLQNSTGTIIDFSKLDVPLLPVE